VAAEQRVGLAVSDAIAETLGDANTEIDGVDDTSPLTDSRSVDDGVTLCKGGEVDVGSAVAVPLTGALHVAELEVDVVRTIVNVAVADREVDGVPAAVKVGELVGNDDGLSASTVCDGFGSVVLVRAALAVSRPVTAESGERENAAVEQLLDDGEAEPLAVPIIEVDASAVA